LRLRRSATGDRCGSCPILAAIGYRFNLRTGLSADGRSYRLPPAARVNVDPTGEATTLKPL
jgi:hypothetical protein